MDIGGDCGTVGLVVMMVTAVTRVANVFVVGMLYLAVFLVVRMVVLELLVGSCWW